MEYLSGWLQFLYVPYCIVEPEPVIEEVKEEVAEEKKDEEEKTGEEEPLEKEETVSFDIIFLSFSSSFFYC